MNKILKLCQKVFVWPRPLDLQQWRVIKDCYAENRAWRCYTTEKTWGFGSHDVNLRSCSGNVECWCPHLLNLFTKLSHYLFCVRISLGCGRIGQMGFRTFLQAWNSQDWTDGLQEATFRPWTHGKRKRKGKKMFTPSLIGKHRGQYKMRETCRVSTHLSSSQLKLEQGFLSRRCWTTIQQLQIPVWLLISWLLTNMLEGSSGSKVPQCFLISVFSSEHMLFLKTNKKPHLNYKRV